MHQYGGISEVFPDYSVIREEIRSKKHVDVETLFGEMILQIIFLRRVETDTAFRWNVCIKISSDEESSDALRKTFTNAASVSSDFVEDGLLRLRMMEKNPDAICCLFAEESDLPVHYWQTKRAGFLYQTIAYQTALQTQPPEKPGPLHPMDRVIISSFMEETEGYTITADIKESSGIKKYTDIITAVACRSFLALSYDERISILNRRYPEDGWETLIRGFMIFEPSQHMVLDGARYCAATHQIIAARSLYSQACCHTDDPHIKHLSYREMGLISRNIGEYERAFSEFQSALEAARESPEDDSTVFHDELIYLCETAEKLGLSEEGNTIFDRLISIARNLKGEERSRLLIQIASSCRRSGWFDREYALIEDLIGEDECSDRILSRLDTMNRAMRRDGTLDTSLLLDLEAGAGAEYTALRGILAFGAFQFDDAFIWFNTSVSVKNTPEARLWRARAAWYANKPYVDLYSAKDDLLETRIISALLRKQTIREAAKLIYERDDEESYDAILVILEAMRGKNASSTVSSLAESIQKESLPQENKSRILRTIGKVLSECGIPDAIPILRKALKMTTVKESRAEVLSEIGYWHETQGQAAKAVEAYMRAIIIHQQFPGGWFGLARAYAQNGEYDAAEEAINSAIRYMPGKEEYLSFRELLLNMNSTHGLDPAMQQRIDEIDHCFFTWGGEVPSSYANRYQALINSDSTGTVQESSEHGLPLMMASEEVLRIRNSVIQALQP